MQKKADEPEGQWVEDDARSLRLVYDTAWNVIEDRSLSGALRARHVHGPRIDEILLHEGGDGAKLYPLADGLGSTVALTDVTGSVTRRFRYDAYGSPTALSPSPGPSPSTSGSAGYRFLFTGREWLGLAGLQDNRYRVYSATLGRWLQVDPIRFAAGDYNLSRYVHGKVTVGSDPFGLACGSGLLDPLVPDEVAGFNMGPCCVGHDDCFSSCGYTKSECDSTFRSCMKAVCDGNEVCLTVANFYADAVATFGGSAYKAAQKKAGCCQ